MATHFPDLPHFRGDALDPRRADILERLRQQRILLLGQEIDDEQANETIALLLHLDLEDPGEDIHMHINSSGGSFRACLSIIDTMEQLHSDVVTVCLGQAAGASALVLAAGTQGKRYALPHARIKLHQPRNLIDNSYPVTDWESQAQEVLHLRHQVNQLLAHRTRRHLEQIESEMERGLFLSAQEAQEYGIIDQIITPEQL
jgi:ATP-dependent Clp protease, protease subunit